MCSHPISWHLCCLLMSGLEPSLVFTALKPSPFSTLLSEFAPYLHNVLFRRRPSLRASRPSIVDWKRGYCVCWPVRGRVGGSPALAFSFSRWVTIQLQLPDSGISRQHGDGSRPWIARLVIRRQKLGGGMGETWRT